jgi:histone-binding protein RBBP4
LKLVGHTKEGYGLSWNEKKPGYIVSGGYDGRILVWNVDAATEKG